MAVPAPDGGRYSGGCLLEPTDPDGTALQKLTALIEWDLGNALQLGVVQSGRSGGFGLSFRVQPQVKRSYPHGLMVRAW
jgi:hypothetical protein